MSRLNGVTPIRDALLTAHSLRSRRAMTTSRPSFQAWMILVIGVLTQMAATLAITGPAFLIPYMHADLDFTLTQSGTVAAAPSFGLILTLIAWGAFADRYAERLAMTLGIGFTALASAAAVAVVDSPVRMVIIIAASGAAAASVNSASGRVVMGWFPRHRRGLAMGIRQMSQPLGTSIAAVTVPPVAAAGGLPASRGLVAAVTGTLATVCFALVRNPPQAPTRAEVADLERRNPSDPAATAGEEAEHGDHEEVGPTSAGEGRARPSSVFNPYRGDSFLWRIHAASALL